MESSVVTVKGQVVIPASIRKSLGIKQGSKVCFIEGDHEVTIRPLTNDYFEKMAGCLKSKGKATKSLLESRGKDRHKEDR